MLLIKILTLMVTMTYGRNLNKNNQYMGEYERPDVSGRKFEPVFIFKKC